jgi:hypothetical protein
VSASPSAETSDSQQEIRDQVATSSYLYQKPTARLRFEYDVEPAAIVGQERREAGVRVALGASDGRS